MKAMRFGRLIGITLESKIKFSQCSSSDLEPWKLGMVLKHCGRRGRLGFNLFGELCVSDKFVNINTTIMQCRVDMKNYNTSIRHLDQFGM